MLEAELKAPKLLIDRANGSTGSWLAPQIAARDSTDAPIVCLYYSVFRVFAALLLALITLFTNYTNVDLLGAASVELKVQRYAIEQRL